MNIVIKKESDTEKKKISSAMGVEPMNVWSGGQHPKH